MLNSEYYNQKICKYCSNYNTENCNNNIKKKDINQDRQNFTLMSCENYKSKGEENHENIICK